MADASRELKLLRGAGALLFVCAAILAISYSILAKAIAVAPMHEYDAYITMFTFFAIYVFYAFICINFFMYVLALAVFSGFQMLRWAHG